jgi:hypothetical protein
MVVHTAASAAMPGPADTAASAPRCRGPGIRTKTPRSMNWWTKAGCRPTKIQLARQKVNELLDQHPQNVWQTLEMLQNGTISKTREAKLRDMHKTCWHGTQLRMSMIPKYWMQAYMLDINPELKKHLRDIKRSSNNAMKELFYATQMLSGSTLVPDDRREKVVFAKMLRERYAQCGSRLARAHLWHMIPGFEWTRLPIFTLTVENDFIASITHISGATYSIPEKQSVPAGGEWMNFWSDTEAVYKAGVVTLFMKDIFDLSSLRPQQCLADYIRDNEGQEGQEPTTPTKTPTVMSKEEAIRISKEEASSSKKARFNTDLLPVRTDKPGRRRTSKGLGHSNVKVKVSDMICGPEP